MARSVTSTTEQICEYRTQDLFCVAKLHVLINTHIIVLNSIDRLGVTILLSNIELGVGCIAVSVPAITWSLFARSLSNHFQNPSDIEQMSLSLLEMREAEGWGLQRKQSQLHSPSPSSVCQLVSDDLSTIFAKRPFNTIETLKHEDNLVYSK